MDIEKIKMRIYFVGAFVGLMLGILAFFVQPIQWKGEALIRIGQITKNQTLIEPLTSVLERLKSPSFIEAVNKRIRSHKVGSLLNYSLSVKPVRNSDVIVVSVVDASKESVKSVIDTVVAELISKHDHILNAYKSDIYKELLTLEHERAALSKRLDVINKEKNYVSGFEVMTIQHDLDSKLNRASALRQVISSVNISSTELLEPTFVVEKLMLPSLISASLLGMLLGLLLNVLLVRWKR